MGEKFDVSLASAERRFDNTQPSLALPLDKPSDLLDRLHAQGRISNNASSPDLGG